MGSPYSNVEKNVFHYALVTNPQHGNQVAQAQALGHSHPYEAAHYQQPQSVNLKIQAVPPQVHPQGVQQLMPQQAFA